jgi:hypothetical protein
VGVGGGRRDDAIVDARRRGRGNLSIVVTPHASFRIDDNPFAPYDVIGELGSRPLPVYVARQSALGAAGGQLVVAERFVGAGKAGDASGADLRREARRLTTLANPHLARVREIASRGDDLVVFGDFIDGEKIAQFWPSEGGAASLPFRPLPLEVALRVLLDVLTGAGALHGLRDTSQQPMKLTHGEISPATVLFGADGVGRLLHAVARRAAGVKPEAASVPYLAPEVHSGDAQDARTDVFSVGILLWEALTGRLLSPAGTEAAGLRVRSGELPAPSAPEKAPWAKALVAVVVRALAAAPEDRWPTAASMAGEIRKASGLKLAAASAAAAFAKSAIGDHAKERRARWEATSKALPFAPAASPPKASAAPRALSLAPAVPWAAVPVPAPSMPAPLFSVPSAARSEEFSSSVLESYRPPPPPVSAPPAVVEPPRGLEELALQAPVPEAPSSDGPLPFEAPVVFDEMPSTSRSEAAPALPVFSMAEALRPRPASRRRLLIGGAAGAVAVAAVAFFAVRSGRAPQPSEAPAPTVQAAAAAVVPSATEASPAPFAPSPSTAGAPMAPALPAKASVAQAPTAPPPKAKGGPKPHAAGSAAAHTKSAPVRAAGRAKPGSN